MVGENRLSQSKYTNKVQNKILRELYNKEHKIVSCLELGPILDIFYRIYVHSTKCKKIRNLKHIYFMFWGTELTI